MRPLKQSDYGKENIENGKVKMTNNKEIQQLNKYRSWKSYFYLVPAILFILLFVYSAIFTFIYSFTDWDGIKKPSFVGFSNYLEIFSNSVFLTSFINTAIWVIVSLIVPVGLGLFLSVILQDVIGSTIFKNIFYLPYAISLTTTGIIWSFLFSSSGINELLELIGVSEQWIKSWMAEPPYNTIGMIIASVWQSTGTNMILFLVGLQSLPREPHEAAMIDGASKLRTFFSITLPLLKPFTIVVVGISLVNSFKIFDIIWVMTQGGPYRSSETLAVTMYRESFVLNNLGLGSAISIVLTALIFILSWFYLRQTIVKED